MAEIEKGASRSFRLRSFRTGNDETSFKASNKKIPVLGLRKHKKITFPLTRGHDTAGEEAGFLATAHHYTAPSPLNEWLVAV